MEFNSLLKTFPRLQIFLPLYYILWEDHLISPFEDTSVQAYISSLTWLENDERIVLQSWLFKEPETYPGFLYSVRDWVRSRLKNIPITENAGIIKLGILSSDSAEINSEIADQLLDKQGLLGMLGADSIYHFFPERRKSQTQSAGTQYTFDIKTMTRWLDGDQITINRELRDLIASGEFDHHQSDDVNVYREHTYKAMISLANKGYGAIAYPEEYGGCSDMAGYFSVMEMISMCDLSMTIKFGVQFGLFGMSVMALGTEKHHKQYLQDIGLLKLAGCFAMTETNHGSNVKGIETTATYDHAKRSFVIHTPHPKAQKEYIGNAAVHGQMATVFAKLIIDQKDYGVCAILVPIRNKKNEIMPGVHIEDCGRKMGLNGVDNGKLRFDRVLVPYENLLDRFISIDQEGKFLSPISSDSKRFFTMLGTLVGGRIGVPRSALTAMKVGLTIAIQYADQRKQFGPEGKSEIPILNYRIHQRRLIPYIAKSYACHTALRYITHRFLIKSDKDAQEIEALAAGIKAYTTWTTTQALQECREACGGKGYLSENRIGDLKNDSEIYTTFEGDNTVLMQLVAKSRLTEFKQSFNQSGVSGVINYLAAQAIASISQMNPVAIRNTDEKHLLDPEFHLNAFKYHEQSLLSSVAKRLKKLLGEGMDSFDAFNVCQHHLIEMAHAYTERVILEQFIKSIIEIKDTACKKALFRVAALFALHTIEEDRAWYLESGYMESSKTKAIRKLVNQICWDMRSDAIPLVESFAIPGNCLGKINQ